MRFVALFLLLTTVAHSTISRADDEMLLNVMATYSSGGCVFSTTSVTIDLGQVDTNQSIINKTGTLTVNCTSGLNYRIASDLNKNDKIIAAGNDRLPIYLHLDSQPINCSPWLGDNLLRLHSQSTSTAHQRFSNGADTWHYCVQIDNSVASTATINNNIALFIEAL